MSAATIITNATAGAPVLNGTEGSLSALFRYLAPILGWSIKFDNGPIIVVKPQSYKGGQALFYRIDDRAARGGAAPRVAEVRAYETMSNINTGAGLVGPGYIHKSYYANTTGYPYNIGGDQFGFFLNSNLYKSSFETSPTELCYLGFLNKLRESDIPVCALFSNPTDGESLGNFIGYQSPPDTTGKPGLYIHKSSKGVRNTKVALRSGGLFEIEGHGIGTQRSGTDFVTNKSMPDNEVLAAPIYVNDGAAYSVQKILPAVALQSLLATGYTQFLFFDGISTWDGYDVAVLSIPEGDSFRP